jgi:molybdopterin molybdotransferase
LVISTGGVSVGDYDYIDELLASLGANIHVRSVAIKPGKPLTVATMGNLLYFGIPGNPVSSMMSFWRFIRGAIAKLNGGNPSYWYPQFIKATTTEDLHAQGRRETYLWGNLTYQKGHPVFQPVKNYSSGNLISVIGANSLAVMRVNQTYVPAGDEVMIMLI